MGIRPVRGTNGLNARSTFRPDQCQPIHSGPGQPRRKSEVRCRRSREGAPHTRGTRDTRPGSITHVFTMRRLLLRFFTAIQLTRLTMAFGAVSDLWFVILFTKAEPDYVMVDVHGMPLEGALVAAAVVAIGLFAYGASLNDVLDVRHDATFSPDRPIPAGRIRLGQAIVVTIGALIVAMLGAIALGDWAPVITLLAAAAILFYNAAGKFIPAVGLVTIGLIHAAHMFIPNHELSFTLPVWLTMTHALGIAACVHVLEDKRPRLNRRAMVATALGWLCWSGIILVPGAMSDSGLWPSHASRIGLVYPLLAVMAFIAVAWWKASGVTGRASAEKLKRYGAMWQSLYGAAWLLAVGLIPQAIWIGLLAVAGFIAMTLIKEITGLSGRPVTYRA
jgi:4-hydroxybenzoate polyprenyltransferase